MANLFQLDFCEKELHRTILSGLRMKAAARLATVDRPSMLSALFALVPNINHSIENN